MVITDGYQILFISVVSISSCIGSLVFCCFTFYAFSAIRSQISIPEES